MGLRDPVRLVTARLVVRLARPSEAAAVARYWSENRAFHAPWSPRLPADFYRAGAWEKRIREDRAAARRGEGVRLFLFDPGEGEVLGHVSLSRVTRGPFHCANLGYALAEKAAGRGLMTEALRAVIAHAFGEMGLHRLEANHVPTNRRSAAVLRGLGFRREGLALQYLRIDGKWQDHVLNALTNTRWRERGP